MSNILKFFRTPTSPSLEELRENAWRVDGTFLVRITDKRLTDIEREVIRRIAKKLYKTDTIER